MLKTTRISFGGTAAIVTSMALMTGLEAANASKATELTALLIAAVADNLSDSLSVHLYQESEGLERREAFKGTLTNFATRFVVCLSFVFIVLMFERQTAALGGIVWGLTLLSVLSFMLARQRNVGVFSEVAKHLAVAVVIIFASRGLGHWITNYTALRLESFQIQ